MKSYYHWEPVYFESYVFPLVLRYNENYPWMENENESFTVEQFILMFNRVPSNFRKNNFGKFSYVFELSTNYHYHYNVVAKMLLYMSRKNHLSVRFVSVGSRTEPIFQLKK